MPKLLEVRTQENYRIWVKFSDGVEGDFDLSELVGKGVFAVWQDYREFQKVYLGVGGEIARNQDIELCPDAVYLKLTGKKPEDIFPKLQELTGQHA
ncbi:MAG: hypothetical protein ANABAC_2879 [Anaerolineae bacterium]|nr:MAG: hypothetical protein ANABAC_2879 [Anaerolineae bacterium]